MKQNLVCSLVAAIGIVAWGLGAVPLTSASPKVKPYASERLAVGSTAPDIVGTDHEDKEFKLSDYRGKVVLLDFWGIW